MLQVLPDRERQHVVQAVVEVAQLRDEKLELVLVRNGPASLFPDVSGQGMRPAGSFIGIGISFDIYVTWLRALGEESLTRPWLAVENRPIRLGRDLLRFVNAILDSQLDRILEQSVHLLEEILDDPAEDLGHFYFLNQLPAPGL